MSSDELHAFALVAEARSQGLDKHERKLFLCAGMIEFWDGMFDTEFRDEDASIAADQEVLECAEPKE